MPHADRLWDTLKYFLQSVHSLNGQSPRVQRVTMHEPCRNLIYIYQHFKFAQGYLTNNISSLIHKSAWDTQIDLHRDSWKSRLLKRPILGEMCLTVLIICLQVSWHSFPIPRLLLGEHFQESGHFNPLE